MIRREVVSVKQSLFGNVDKMAKLINQDYEELTAGEYCLRYINSYEVGMGKYRCRKTGNLVIGIDGRATVNAIRCR